MIGKCNILSFFFCNIKKKRTLEKSYKDLRGKNILGIVLSQVTLLFKVWSVEQSMDMSGDLVRQAEPKSRPRIYIS